MEIKATVNYIAPPNQITVNGISSPTQAVVTPTASGQITSVAVLTGPAGPTGATGPQGLPGTTTDYTLLINKPTLGTAAATDTTAYASAAQGVLAGTAVQPAGIANFETTSQLNTRDTNNRSRSNHTGTQLASTISDIQTTITNNSAVLANTAKNTYPSGDATKLAGIATGATANSSDATLLNRANHTGTQAESTITNLVSDLAAKADVNLTIALAIAL